VIAPLSKCRDERSEFYGIKEGQGRFYKNLQLRGYDIFLIKIDN
jgi:hypothetical protein